MNLVTRICVTALAIVLIAPAFKSRFDLPNLLVYYLPMGVFVASVLLANLLDVRDLGGRLGHAALFLLYLFGPALALFLDGGRELPLFTTIVINTSIGMAIVMFPWTMVSMHQMMQAFAGFGAILAVHTILFFGSDEAIREIQIQAGEDYAQATSYLAISFAMGVGVLSSTYLVVKGFSPASLVAFGVNWMGLAMGRGRGSFLFCVLLTFIYLVLVLRGRIAGFSRSKKTISVIMIASLVPLVFFQVMKIERMREGLRSILFNLDVEAERGGRAELFQIALNKIGDAPFLGGGLGEYMNNPFGHPHNLFLQWGVDSGLVGMAGLVLFLLIICWRILISLRMSDQYTVNMIYVTTMLFLFMMLNFLKSGDPYLSRTLPIMAALPIAGYLAVLHSTGRLKARRMAFGRRSAGRELTPDIIL